MKQICSLQVAWRVRSLAAFYWQ